MMQGNGGQQAVVDTQEHGSDPKIDLGERRRFTDEEAVQLVDQFAALHPDLYEEWRASELRGNGIEHISIEIVDFVFSRVTSNHPGNIALALVDLRGEIIRRAKSASE